MSEDQILIAGCKVNLYFKITGRRKDGLHEIKSLFYPLDYPHDTLYIYPLTQGKGFQLSCSLNSLEDEINILSKVWQLFGEKTGFWPDIKLHLHKEIPIGAGLGGGSSDAAVFLKYLQTIASSKSRLSEKALLDLARNIGSDVPFFLFNRPAWVEGIGDEITLLENLHFSRLCMLVVCPFLHISTAEAYRIWDESQSKDRNKSYLNKLLTKDAFIFNKLFCEGGQIWCNSFEDVIFNKYPILRWIKENLLTRGASAVVLSGSGSSMVALVRSKSKLDLIQDFVQGINCTYFLKRF